MNQSIIENNHIMPGCRNPFVFVENQFEYNLIVENKTNTNQVKGFPVNLRR